jgi:hypothetical protein
MGRVHESITPALAEFIGAQKMFFVATAPSAGGHVNVSPKGHDTLRVLDDRRVAYLDLTGSGIETVAHLRDNARITVMWCAFEGPPRIVRVQGTGEVVPHDDQRFAELAARFEPHRGARAVIVISADRVADSCGFSVPLMQFVDERDQLDRWTDRKSDGELAAYRSEKNSASIDGLPALPPADG